MNAGHFLILLKTCYKNEYNGEKEEKVTSVFHRFKKKTRELVKKEVWVERVRLENLEMMNGRGVCGVTGRLWSTPPEAWHMYNCALDARSRRHVVAAPADSTRSSRAPKSWDARGGHLHPSLFRFLFFISLFYLPFILWAASMCSAMPTQETLNVKKATHGTHKK